MNENTTQWPITLQSKVKLTPNLNGFRIEIGESFLDFSNEFLKVFKAPSKFLSQVKGITDSAYEQGVL
jgi:hypothetical protein